MDLLFRRLVRNRESASQSRERKKQRMADMEQRCAGLEEQVRALSRAVTATALENAALREELARQQMYHYPSAVAAAPGRSRGRGAKKSNGTEPAVLSSGTCATRRKDMLSSVISPERVGSKVGADTRSSGPMLASRQAVLKVDARMAQLVQAVGGTVVRLADLPPLKPPRAASATH